MVSLWVVGVAFIVVIVVQCLWALDLLIADARRALRLRRWRWLAQSGDIGLALFNLALSVLFGYFTRICFADPFRQTEGWLAGVILMMAGFAVWAWYYLPKPPAEKGL